MQRRPVLFFLLGPALGAVAGCRARGEPAVRTTAAHQAADTVPAPGGAAALPARTVASEPDSVRTAALDVLRAYYAAIAARDYARAYAAWGPGGPPGQPTPAAFRAGYASTGTVTLQLGAPGRLEGAAGSRYLTVPVTVVATEHGGRRVRYTGTYTLRQRVVPGGSPASRRWHLHSAVLTRAADAR